MKKNLANGKKKKVAVFDIDGTICRSSLLLELIETLVNEDVFPKEVRSSYIYSWERWRARQGIARTGFSYNEFIDDVVNAFRKNIKGLKRDTLQKYAKKVADRESLRLYRYTRGILKRLKNSYFLLAISHSPFEIVSPFTKSLGFDKAYATVFEVDDRERYTGKVMYEDIIFHKDKVLKRFLKGEEMNLKDSIGVGDTDTDIAFLKMVANPIAFNPSMRLYKAAKKYKWKVIVERKDVIYEMKKLL